MKTLNGSKSGVCTEIIALSSLAYPIARNFLIYSMLLFLDLTLVMPAKATIFDKKCNPLLDLGSGPYNTIRWNPKGRCILHGVDAPQFFSFLFFTTPVFFFVLYISLNLFIQFCAWPVSETCLVTWYAGLSFLNLLFCSILHH